MQVVTSVKATIVRGVLFDLGGTLFGYNAEMGAATGAALRRLHLDPASAEVIQALRTAAHETSSTYATRPTYLHRDLFRDQLSRAVSLLGRTLSPTDLDQFEDENRANIINHMHLRDGAAAMLSALQDRGLYRAVVSNADEDFLEPTLARNGVDALLDDWTSSEAAGSCKPDPAIYRFALRKAHLSADEVLFVGDSLQHDVAGAHAAGLRTVLIENGLPAAPFSHGLESTVSPDYEVTTLGEIVEIVDQLNTGQ